MLLAIIRVKSVNETIKVICEKRLREINRIKGV